MNKTHIRSSPDPPTPYIGNQNLILGFNFTLQKIFIQRRQMKLRAAGKTRSKIPLNLSLHRQIFEIKVFKQESGKSVYKMQFFRKFVSIWTILMG